MNSLNNEYNLKGRYKMNDFLGYDDDEFLSQIDESIEFEMDENTFENDDDVLTFEYESN